MTKSFLAASVALTLAGSPVAFSSMAMAQNAGGSGSASSSEKMKGPPNADGMTKDGMTKGGASDDMKAGRSEDSNGAAAAKATGEDKK